MPANINIDPNISLGIKSQDSMTSLSNLLNAANAAQQYKQSIQMNPLQVQQQTQLTEQGKYATEKAAQENQERINTQTFLSDPKNWQTDGRIDINLINAALPKIAPLTGDATISRLTALADAQTKGIKAKLNLDTEQRAIIAGPLDILGRLGIEDKEKYINELDFLKKKNPKNKDLHDLIDSQKVILENVPKGTSLASMAIRGSQELLNPVEKETAFRQTAGTADTGAGVVQTVTTPSIGGAQPTIKVGNELLSKQIAPGSTETIVKDATGNDVIVVRDRAGNITGVKAVPANAPTATPRGGNAQAAPVAPVSPEMGQMRYQRRDMSQPQMNIPPDERVAFDDGVKTVKLLRDGAAELTTAKNNLNNVIKTATGLQEGALPSSGAIGSWVRTLRNAAGDPTYKTLSKELANVQIAQIKSSGGSMDTVAGQQLSKYANGDETYPPEVLIKIANESFANILNTEMQADAAEKFTRKFGEANIGSFKDLWRKNSDTKAFQLLNLNKESEGLDKNSAEYKKIKLQTDSLLGPNPTKRQELIKKITNLQKLTNNGEL